MHDVATGKDRQVWNGEGAGQVLGWGPGGVYFTRQPVTPSGVRGSELWVVDPANRAGSHRVGPSSFQSIAGGAAWEAVYGPVTAFRPDMPASGDSHGVWLSVPGSLWLYRNGSLTKVADIPSGLFPSPTSPPGLRKGSAPSPPPRYPTGVSLNIAGACG